MFCLCCPHNSETALQTDQNEYEIQCPHCPATYHGSVRSLNQHIEREHVDELPVTWKPFACPDCKLQFGKTSVLRKHAANMHGVELDVGFEIISLM